MGSQAAGATETRAPAHRSRDGFDGTSSSWGWRWVGWASWSISPAAVWLAGTALVVDVVSSWWGEPEWRVGPSLMSPALPLALFLAVLVGPRVLGFTRRHLHVWREFLVFGAGLVLLGASTYQASTAAARELEGVFLTIVTEELVYRLAAVVLIGALCARLAGRNWRDTAEWGTGAALAGVVGAGVAFSALPGHVDQITGASNACAFWSLGIVLGYTALRTGSLLPGFLVHLALDLVALDYLAGRLSGAGRVLVGALALTSLVVGLMAAGRRLGLRMRIPAVIDLRSRLA
jgi:hypothetical protein